MHEDSKARRDAERGSEGRLGSTIPADVRGKFTDEVPPNANRVSPIGQEAPESWAAAGDAFDLGIAQVESVRQASVILRPEGRFGADSRSRRERSTSAELGFDSGFVDCGSGVVNLMIRPHAGPFDAEVRAVVTPLTDRFERPKDAATETTPFVRLGSD